MGYITTLSFMDILMIMTNNHQVIAIIPARSGSKRIPGKNTRHFLGQPIIKYSIDAALQSGIFSEVMVSTDSQVTTDLATSFGAKVPFLRSAASSDDSATVLSVLKEVLGEYQKQGREFEYAFCIFPTAPFITPAKIKKAFATIQTTQADVVVAVTRYGHPIERALKLTNNGRIIMIKPEHMSVRTQDLTPAYFDAGQYFCFKVNTYLSGTHIFADNTVPIITSELEAQDIDNEEDWQMAELKYQLFTTLSKKSTELGAATT